MKDTEVMGLGNFSLRLRKPTEDWHVADESLPGAWERPLCEALRVKPGLCWRHQML